ncbi:MAG TPA: dihydrofolate reductase family protein [Anaerolineales bacterium]|nr:dihydrofolate reductase family protein [Anaerolineales bacterium]
MASLIYFMPMSLDGLIAGQAEDMDWASPDEEISAFINERHRPIGTYLYGRRNYETMMVWDTPDAIPGLNPAMMDFGRIWKAADKIVYSRSLEAVSTPKTRLEREFEPRAIRERKARSAHDISVAGPNLAGQAIRAGLVDEYQLLVVPVLLGRGKRVLPDDTGVKLDLLDERRFGNGWVYLRYRTRA